tara:strand:- start:500 stop:829 length:330 start_codon:yes stop_codon:yes gene_type:complete
MAVYTQTNAPKYVIDNVYLVTNTQAHDNGGQQISYNWNVLYTPDGQDQTSKLISSSDIVLDANNHLGNVTLLATETKAGFLANAIPTINAHATMMTATTQSEKNDWRSE